VVPKMQDYRCVARANADVIGPRPADDARGEFE
jgi:hypothetical protein